MKKQLYTSILFIIISIISFSSCRKDHRPAEMHADTQTIIFKKNTTTQYISIVNTGNSLLNYNISSNESYISVHPTSGTLGFNEMAKVEINANTDNLGFGIHQSDINISSNGGNNLINVTVLKPYPDPPLLWWDIDYIKIPSNSNKDYITIKNNGEETLEYNLSTPSDWMSFSQSSGSLQAGQSEIVWVNVDRSGLSNDLYSSFINIASNNAGTAKIDVDMEVGVYSVSFFNPTYTEIDINVPGDGAYIIPVLNRINYVYPSNPGSIYYTANTSGETVGSQTLGLTITWEETINLSSEVSPIYDLNISDNFFFLSVINSGSHHLDQWSINYDTPYQFDEDVDIPNDNQEYYFGYYDALNNSNVYARIVGTNNDAVWENGQEFDFPWTMNQSILLESGLKSSIKNGNRSFIQSGKGVMTLKTSTISRSEYRIRNSKPLTNASSR